jgi:hypothetical protein
MAEEKVVIRGGAVTDELHDLIAFLVQSFVRPLGSELYAIRHNDVTISKDWRWGLVFNQGNGMNVTEERVRERLRTIAGRLLRKMYGNHYRSRGNVRFIVFQHGSPKRHNRIFTR